MYVISSPCRIHSHIHIAPTFVDVFAVRINATAATIKISIPYTFFSAAEDQVENHCYLLQ